MTFPSQQVATVFRWLGRIASLVILFFLGLFLVGEGLPPITLQSLCFPFTLMVGLILAWKWEALGGALALLSVAVFYALEYAGEGTFPQGPFFLIAASPGLPFVISGLFRGCAPACWTVPGRPWRSADEDRKKFGGDDRRAG